MKIAVAIPVYDGKLPVEVVRCLLNEQAAAHVVGDDLTWHFLSSCSHPAMGRNQLANDFLESDAERLVFLDADVTFEVGAILRIAKHPFDFVGGAYRYKQAYENYPVGWALDENKLGVPMNGAGLLLVESLPGGFLSLSRKVFADLKSAHPDRGYAHFGKQAHCYFQMPFSEGSLYGEDSFFCKEWRNTGGKVWLDPELTLTHWDFNRPYAGHIGKWLKGQSKLEAQQ